MKQFFFILFFPAFLLAEKVVVEQIYPEIENPWFTGPLIAPTPVIVPLGHINYEPYVYVTAIPGVYDANWDSVPAAHNFWTNSLQPLIQIGLTSWMDIEVTPTLYYNSSNHTSHWGPGDIPVELDIQLLHIRHNPWIPVIKLAFIETFPVGKYKNLTADKNGVQATGEGSFQTAVSLVVGKIIHLSGIHFMDARIALQYNVPAPVHLTGRNTYGGAADTDARFFPPQSFTADLAFEFTLAQHWAFACDLIGIWSTRSRFSGNPGTNPDGSPALLGPPSSFVFEIAPALEYNWNDNLGMIGGCYLSVGGRNTVYFRSGVIAINYYQ